MAFDSLTEKLQNVFKKLRGKGRLTEDDVKVAMKEVKLALLEADVNFRVVKQFIKDVQERAIGQDVMNGLNPGQMVIKIVNEDGSKASFWNILYREVIGRFLAGLPIIAYAGYLMIIPDQEKRGLHDRLCDTRVIYDEQVNHEKTYDNANKQDEINRLFNVNEEDYKEETVETIIQSAEEIQTKIDDMSEDINNIINNVSDKEL